MLALSWVAAQILPSCAKADPPSSSSPSPSPSRSLSSSQAQHKPAVAAAGAQQQSAPTPLEPLAVEDTIVVVAEIVLPSHADTRGVCFGGQILSWIDLTAGIAAKKLARGPCVTASVDSVQFLKPSVVGDVIILSAMVNRTFNTSMEIGVRVETESMRSGERKYCCSAYLTFVSIDAQGRPAPVRQVIPQSADESRRYSHAQLRRQQRLERRSRGEVIIPLEWNCFDDGHQLSKSLLPANELDQVPRRYAKQTLAHMTQVVLPGNANTVGVTFGGDIMAWIERCAYISASRLCRNVHLLSASVDSLHFLNPTRVGDIVYITSMVTAAFTSSIEVLISVYGENPLTGDIKHCNDAFMTLVTVDESGVPLRISNKFTPESETELARQRDSIARRELRLRARQKLRRNSNESIQQQILHVRRRSSDSNGLSAAPVQ
ncbi:acyl-CoA thioesterase 11 [Capsaspora owczarzaki ATCC 30864]|uniref:Acyl-CoA thioesterase 11 n=1 Tax=Capsaspora owczarzaki (strain ATCC 30864) TaxID=595528 RepID=A0A0D2WMB8_CAPO3|nr:acyl-CoA thioesterase 11 [Capsaspora owczarzaki ATCC 30864]KJE91945.1 acyl-CoA thioesterase 11 [Capsaspora owczarzaki ATCC 30864]|eukprot:XP_004363831.1 acyl-CoA thioesterase 11 [Capsaspora owczarzaki ATCC 30864]